MSTRGALVERPARIVVGTVGRVRRYRATTSLIGLLLVLLIGTGYLLFGALDINPLAAKYQVRVELRESGGLLPGQDVTLRGVRIGRVASVEVAGDKVVAVASIDERTRIPMGGRVRTAALSAAGEQYLDFLPDTDSGPFLAPGAVVTADRTSSPVPLSTMLEGLSGILAQVDPGQLRAISDELGVGEAGPDKLAAIIDGGFFMISTLDGVLPQTVSLLRNSRVLLTTLADSGAGLRDTAADLSATMGGIAAMGGGFEQLVGRTPETLAAIDAIMAQNSPTMVRLLGDLTTVAHMANSRVPAFEEFFFPQQRAGSSLDAVASAFHDGSVWAMASIYPRKQCDYNVPRRPGTVPDYPEPYLYTDCTDPDPALLPRGARNAPRPPGVGPPGVPPGADPAATADPTPIGPLTIPTPYGGPHAPTYVPPN
ncbi:MlaD family protein [Nocardia sp. NPDC019395]|uniref:MlaD family protein n=1 Tax=Nocardia sp. NPDC019395 TaxID=3154686 RepID=UPI0033D5710B